MVKKIAVILLATVLAFCQLGIRAEPAQNPKVDHLAQREYEIPAFKGMIYLNSIGLLQCNDGGGTAWIVDRNVIATAAHVVGDSSVCKIGDQYAYVVAKDAETDFALLTVELNAQQVRIKMSCRNPENGEMLYGVGFALGEHFIVNPLIYRYGVRRLIVDGQDIMDVLKFSGAAYRGMSGGPVIDQNGNAIGVLVAVSTDNTEAYVRSFSSLKMCMG